MALPFFQRGILPIGLDIGESSVKLLQLQRERGLLRIVDAVREPLATPLSQAGSKRGPIIQEAVRAALRGRNFIGARCVCSLPPSDVLLRTMRTTPMPDAELDSGCRWEAAQRFEVEVDDLEAAWLRAGEVVQGDSVREEILLLAIRREQITPVVDALLGVGLRPVCIDTSFTAVARCLGRNLRRLSDSDVVQMALDVGAATTDVIIIRGNSIAFIKSIPIGGRRLTEAVAEALRLEPQAAQQVRWERMQHAAGEGGAGDRRVNRAIFQAVRPFLIDIAEEVALCLRYYSVTFRGARPQRVLLVGGDAQEPGFCEVLHEALKIEVQVARPLESIDRSSVSFDVERRESPLPQWAVACGLSLRPPDVGDRRQPPIEDDQPLEASQPRGSAA